MKKTLAIFLLCFLLEGLHAQEKKDPFDAGFSFQWYPAGIMPGIAFSSHFAPHHAWQVRVAYNRANRHDWGKHDDEKGGGIGFTPGYRYFLDPTNQKWFAGLRSDLWWMKINWKQGGISGTSHITVFQPTLEIGYLFRVGERLFITPAIANGFEINLRTKGEAVGEGFITLVGVQAGWRF